jgi:hypothetical protein
MVTVSFFTTSDFILLGYLGELCTAFIKGVFSVVSLIPLLILWHRRVVWVRRGPRHT